MMEQLIRWLLPAAARRADMERASRQHREATRELIDAALSLRRAARPQEPLIRSAEEAMRLFQERAGG